MHSNNQFPNFITYRQFDTLLKTQTSENMYRGINLDHFVDYRDRHGAVSRKKAKHLGAQKTFKRRLQHLSLFLVV